MPDGVGGPPAALRSSWALRRFLSSSKSVPAAAPPTPPPPPCERSRSLYRSCSTSGTLDSLISLHFFTTSLASRGILLYSFSAFTFIRLVPSFLSTTLSASVPWCFT